MSSKDDDEVQQPNQRCSTRLADQSPLSASSTRTTRSTTRRINNGEQVNITQSTTTKTTIGKEAPPKRRGRPPKPPGERQSRKKNVVTDTPNTGVPPAAIALFVNPEPAPAAQRINPEDGNDNPPDIQQIPTLVATNQKFTDYETSALLTIMRKYLPCGKPEWENVAVQFNKVRGVRARSYDNLRRKFNALAREPPPTGDGEMPNDVAEAKKIRELMIRDSKSVVLGADEDVNPPTLTTPMNKSTIVQGLASMNSEKLARRRPGDSELGEFLKVFLVQDKAEQRKQEREQRRKERKERKRELHKEYMMFQHQQQQSQQMMMFMTMMVSMNNGANHSSQPSPSIFQKMPPPPPFPFDDDSTSSSSDSTEQKKSKKKKKQKKKKKTNRRRRKNKRRRKRQKRFVLVRSNEIVVRSSGKVMNRSYRIVMNRFKASHQRN
jgi:hypothetical protein